MSLTIEYVRDTSGKLTILRVEEDVDTEESFIEQYDVTVPVTFSELGLTPNLYPKHAGLYRLTNCEIRDNTIVGSLVTIAVNADEIEARLRAELAEAERTNDKLTEESVERGYDDYEHVEQNATQDGFTSACRRLTEMFCKTIGKEL